MSAVLLLNAHAGRANRDRLCRALPSGPAVTVRCPSTPSDVDRTVQEAATQNANRIIAAGGDGTVHQVATAMLAQNVNAGLGIVPCGTGNDFAYTLGLPPLWAPAVDVALHGSLRPVDALRLTDSSGRTTHALNGVAGGFAGDVGDAVTNALKDRWGRGAFLVAFAQMLPTLTTYSIRATLDARTLERDVVAFLIMNGRTVGGHKHVAPDASPCDGWMDVVLVRRAPFLRLLRTGARLLRRRWPADDYVEMHRCRQVHVTADRPLALNVDGEPWSNRSFQATVHPGAVQVACPQPATGGPSASDC